MKILFQDLLDGQGLLTFQVAPPTESSQREMFLTKLILAVPSGLAIQKKSLVAKDSDDAARNHRAAIAYFRSYRKLPPWLVDED